MLTEWRSSQPLNWIKQPKHNAAPCLKTTPQLAKQGSTVPKLNREAHKKFFLVLEEVREATII